MGRRLLDRTTFVELKFNSQHHHHHRLCREPVLLSLLNWNIGLGEGSAESSDGVWGVRLKKGFVNLKVNLLRKGRREM